MKTGVVSFLLWTISRICGIYFYNQLILNHLNVFKKGLTGVLKKSQLLCAG